MMRPTLSVIPAKAGLSISNRAKPYRKGVALLGGCALAALSALAHAPQAHAQAFQGTPTVVGGSVQAGVIQGPTTDIILIRNSEVVIDWAPSDTTGTGTVDFLPSGLAGLFINDPQFSTVSDFTVLNRVQPVDASGNPTLRPIAFNGTVQSQVNGTQGGAVWFYSPGGIIAGPTAVFDVGALVLTTNAIDTTGGLFGASGQIRFAGTLGSTSSVEIQSGASISALAAGSYVALVAPRVVQGGTVTVNGSAAYVAAEAVDITINGGLFDISIGTGTDDANGVVHTGTTTGPATSATDPSAQRIFMAAVPKNNALTMLLTGDIGYTAAATAAEENSAVILSAGHDISGGQSLGIRSTSANATISIGNGTFSSAVDGRATGAITINPTSFGTISFDQNAAFKAGTAITAGADNGETIDALADLTLHAGVDGTGGIATLYAAGTPFSTPPEGQVTVGGILTVSSSATGLDSFVAGATGGNASGGTSEIRANGGTISAGSIALFSTATSGLGSGGSGNATGGTARIALTGVNGGGSISAGNVTVDVSASNPFVSSLPPLNGGSATGGTVQISTDGGTIGFSAINIAANASGGTADTGGTAGQATGGNVTISSITSGTGLGTIALTDCASFGCSISADARGGDGPQGANGTGGNVTLTAQDGLFASDSAFFISANGLGGAEGPGGTTGDGLGGNVLIQILPGSANSAGMSFGDLTINADGAGLPIPGDYFGVGNGGLGQGGSVRIDLLGGVLSATSLSMGASGLGGPAGDSAGPALFVAGDGIGGQSIFNANGGFADIATLSIYATGAGGLAQAPSFTGNLMGTAGNGTGGTSRLIATSGTLNLGDVFVHAYGLGGASDAAFDYDSTVGGYGLGGSAEVNVNGGVTLLATSLEVFANGEGGAGGEGFSTGNAGSGGAGTGGTARVGLSIGNVTIPTVTVAANGTGGAGGNHQGTGNPGSGGNGAGGSALLDGNDADYALDAVILEAKGIGGAAGAGGSGVPGIAGNGTGGFVRLSNRDTMAPVNGRLMDSLTLDVRGTGTTILSGRMEVSDVATFTGGGLVITGDLTALGSGPAASSTSGFYFTGAGESISIGGNATIDTGGDAAFMLDGTGGFTVTGALQVNAGQDVFVGHTNNGPTPADSIASGTATFTSAGNFDASLGSIIRTGTDLSIAAGGFARAGDLIAGGNVLLNSGAGIGVNRINAGGTTNLSSSGGPVVVAVDLVSAGLVSVTGQSVGLTAINGLDIAFASASLGDLSISAGQDLNITSGFSGNDLSLVSANGSVTAATLLSNNNLALGAAGDVSISQLAMATAALTINAGGAIAINGDTSGRTIALSSADLVLTGAGVELGIQGSTTQLQLSNSDSSRQTFVGGAGNSTGYSLSTAEMSQLFSDSITVTGSTGQSVVVDSFTMASRASVPTGNLAANGSLAINSSASISVIGDVALTGLGSGNQLFLSAANAVEVDAANASISLTDANGALMGQLNFDADEVFVATSSAVADVRAASGTDAMSNRLSLNDGVVRDSGVIRAATIFADVRGGLYIQNVGATDGFADRRGFAALTDTLDIATVSNATRIIVNGQLIDATGGVLSGVDVIPLVRINGVVGATSGTFDPRSTVNGCLIASPLLCTTTTSDLPGLPPPHDTIEEALDPDDSGSGSDLFPTTVVELKDFQPFGYPPLIDEPVTGAGNDDLWMPPCEDGAETGGCVRQ